MDKDFYEILDIDKNLQGEEFKKSLRTKYKKLALKYHPDRYAKESDEKKKEAEETFKEISEAYNTLIDDKKRQEYDMKTNGYNPFANGGFNPFGGGDFEDFNPFDIFGGNRNQRINKGNDIITNIVITFLESFNGVKKTVLYTDSEICEHCKGTGEESGIINKCTKCNGTGRYRNISQHMGMTLQHIVECSECNGSGKKIITPCKECNGIGYKSVHKSIEVDIPKGFIDGESLVIKGMGEKPNGEGLNGDLYIKINVLNDDNFKRQGNNVYQIINVNFVDCILGCEKEIKTVDNKKLKLKIPELTPTNYQFKFTGYGFIDPRKPFSEKGDMYVIIQYEYPSKLNNKTKELLKQLKENL